MYKSIKLMYSHLYYYAQLSQAPLWKKTLSSYAVRFKSSPSPRCTNQKGMVAKERIKRLRVTISKVSNVRLD